ncbi:peptidoglycan DD-metalloendopeptidase family protein [bacterium]|nr:peptidoglycan DD-metalloendopeptidase family protein [bacterium]
MNTRLLHVISLFFVVSITFGARWPLGGEPTSSPPRLTDPFGARLRSSGAYDFHMGLDIGSPQGTPIHAPFAGQVEDRRWFTGYGNTLWVSHDESFDSFYAHMNDVGHVIGPITEGDVIGEVGNSGGVYAYHLHFARYDDLLSYPWSGGNRIWRHPAHDLPYYNAHPDSGSHDTDSSYFADNESLSIYGAEGLTAAFDLHIPARSFSFLSLQLRIYDTFELIAEYSLEDFLQNYDYDSSAPPSGWEEFQTVELRATTIEDHHPPGTVTFYPEFYQSSQWPNPAHQTVRFVFEWPQVNSITRASVADGAARWSVEITGPNYGTQARFDWSTSSVTNTQQNIVVPELTCYIWPNPFNEATNITYYVPRTGQVTLKFFDVLGRQVNAINYPVQTSGWHQMNFHAHDLPSGIYFVRIESAGQMRAVKMQLVK